MHIEMRDRGKMHDHYDRQERRLWGVNRSNETTGGRPSRDQQDQEHEYAAVKGELGGGGESIAEVSIYLTGRTANRAGYVRCPLHKAGQERTPSLRLYDYAGWYCYGCHTGGDIFTLAALLRGLRPPLRGTDFLIVQAALREHFGPPPTTRASRAPQTAKSGA